MVDNITSALDFYKKIIGHKEVTVKFIKKDGSIRLMRCTLDFTQIQKDKQPKKVSIQKILNDINKFKIIKVYDLDANDWRSVNYETAEWVETPDKIYHVVK
ncbi:MAG: DUF2693 domain-containing protein [Candidatus Peribacteraceae bacterium]|nr:DUF2693 domain-containing protein [Candidatus Peribacteraceae bacterium]